MRHLPFLQQSSAIAGSAALKAIAISQLACFVSIDSRTQATQESQKQGD